MVSINSTSEEVIGRSATCFSSQVVVVSINSTSEEVIGERQQFEQDKVDFVVSINSTSEEVIGQQR